MGRPPFGGDGDRVRGGGRVRVVDTGAAHRGAALRSRRAISTIVITEKRRADPSVVGLAPMVNLAGDGLIEPRSSAPGGRMAMRPYGSRVATGNFLRFQEGGYLAVD